MSALSSASQESFSLCLRGEATNVSPIGEHSLHLRPFLKVSVEDEFVLLLRRAYSLSSPCQTWLHGEFTHLLLTLNRGLNLNCHTVSPSRSRATQEVVQCALAETGTVS